MSFHYDVFMATVDRAENENDPKVWDEIPEARLNAIAEDLHRIAVALEKIAESQDAMV